MYIVLQLDPGRFSTRLPPRKDEVWGSVTHGSIWTHLWHSAWVILLDIRDVDSETSRSFFFVFFPTNLHSFVSFGKTHKLHNAIDHWLAGVAGQAHVTLEAVTEEERAVHTGHGGDRENKEVENSGRDLG